MTLSAMRIQAAYGAARLALQFAVADLRHRVRPHSVAERIAALPTRGLPVRERVEIRWNEHLVPYIDARGDRDLAVALGLVHAHLRLAQMEMFRRIAQGRLAEAVGPIAVPLDHSLRVLGPTRAVPAILNALPDRTRDWLEGFADGLNHWIAAAPPPLELRLLGLVPEPWSLTDLLEIARIAAADIGWLLLLRLLRLPRGDDWPEVWGRMLEGAVPVPSLGTGASIEEALARILLGLGRSGSNAVAVSGERSETGNALLAGDPHLSQGLPSVWIAAAYRSPSYNVAGLMIPGIPVMAIGRNRHIAWGGTNLHAASSELFDVADLPQSEISKRGVRIRVRWGADREVVVRDTAYGPVISDAPVFGGKRDRPVALRWIGHDSSDEITALLAINRAPDWASFRQAAAGLGVPGQTLVYADDTGRIGRQIAAWLPLRHPDPPADVVSPLAAAAAWQGRVTAADLPCETDPPSGFFVSANDRPPDGEVPIGWFFSPDDRADRLKALLGNAGRIGLTDLKWLQRDVAAPAMLELRDRLGAALTRAVQPTDVAKALVAWDGTYAAGSAGALAFELILARLVAAIVPERRRDVYSAAWHARALLTRDIAAIPAPQLARLVGDAVRAVQTGFETWRDWGGAHRLRLAHPFGAAPVIGRRWRYTDVAWPGSVETIMKSAHGLVTGRHFVSYGANARYLFDLADPDGNYLVILGGEDGAPGSDAFLDQFDLFRRGEYLQLPLDPETARARFPHVTVIEPAIEPGT